MSTCPDTPLDGTPDRVASYDWAGVPSSVDESKRALMARHLELVVERNRQVNLTRITDLDEAVDLHVVDSLLLLPALDAAPAGPFVDIGTGAGFPGIPLAIASGRPATLVDSVRKKAVACADFVRELGLADRVRVEAARIEDLGRSERGRYAAVCARAVAQTAVLVEYAAPLLMQGGRLIVAKGRPTDDEVARACRAADVCGLTLVSRETFELPHGRGHREVLVFERYAKPRIRLPRAVGVAKSRPLG